MQAQNIFSFKTAIAEGYNPRDYKFGKTVIPIGTFEAVLDFKIWAYGDLPAVTCYFTLADGAKIRINAFRDRETEEYIPEAGTVNLRYCPINTNYLVTVELTPRKAVKLVSIKPVD